MEVDVEVGAAAACAKLNDVICGGFNFLVEQLSTMQNPSEVGGVGRSRAVQDVPLLFGR